MSAERMIPYCSVSFPTVSPLPTPSVTKAGLSEAELQLWHYQLRGLGQVTAPLCGSFSPIAVSNSIYLPGCLGLRVRGLEPGSARNKHDSSVSHSYCYFDGLLSFIY